MVGKLDLKLVFAQNKTTSKTKCWKSKMKRPQLQFSVVQIPTLQVNNFQKVPFVHHFIKMFEKIVDKDGKKVTFWKLLTCTEKSGQNLTCPFEDTHGWFMEYQKNSFQNLTIFSYLFDTRIWKIFKIEIPKQLFESQMSWYFLQKAIMKFHFLHIIAYLCNPSIK